MKIYEQTIPIWRAVIPADWELEIEVTNPGAENEQPVKTFESHAGRQIVTVEGSRFRTTDSGPASTWLNGAVTHGFVKEVEA